MFQVQVKTSEGVWSELGTFQTEEAAWAWVEEQAPSGAFEFSNVRVVRV